MCHIQTMLHINFDAANYYHSFLQDYEVNEAARPEMSAAFDYLRERDLTRQDVKTFGIGFAPTVQDGLFQFLVNRKNAQGEQMYSTNDILRSGLVKFNEFSGTYYDFFQGRLIFPIINSHHQVISMGGRATLPGQEPKYLNGPETIIFSKRKNLYGAEQAFNRCRTTGMVVCEGYMDLIAFQRSGYPRAVASLGTALTEEQCQKISMVTNKILLAYDMDGPGEKAAARAAQLFKSINKDLEIRRITFDGVKDPDEYFVANGAEGIMKKVVSTSLGIDGKNYEEIVQEEEKNKKGEGLCQRSVKH